MRSPSYSILLTICFSGRKVNRPRYYVFISVVIGHLAASSFDALLSCAFKSLVEFPNTVGALNHYVVCELLCLSYLCIYVCDVALSCVLLPIANVFEGTHNL